MVWAGPKTFGDFNIVVVGNDDIAPHLENMVNEKKLAGVQSMKFIKVNTIEEVENAHIVFLSKSKIDQFETAMKLSAQAGLALYEALIQLAEDSREEV